MGADAAVMFSRQLIWPFPTLFHLLVSVRSRDRLPWKCESPRVADVPVAGALAVGPRAGVPDALVRHDCGCRLTKTKDLSKGENGGEVVGGRLVDLSLYDRGGLQPYEYFESVRAKIRLWGCD